LYFYQRERDTESRAEKENKNPGRCNDQGRLILFYIHWSFSALRQGFALHIGAVSYEGCQQKRSSPLTLNFSVSA
jgi:hypothetical protein